MKNKEEVLFSAGETVEYARQYIKLQGDIVRLEAAERMARVTSSLLTLSVLAVLGMLVLIMLSIAGGFWLSQVFGSAAIAFLCVAIVYIAISGLIYIFRKPLISEPSVDFVLSAFFDTQEDKKEVIKKIENPDEI